VDGACEVEMSVEGPERLLAKARGRGRKLLDEHAAKSLLLAYGVRVPLGIKTEPGQPPALGVAMTPPYVAKLMSPDLVHKSDIGGVRLGLQNVEAVRLAIAELECLSRESGLRLEGVLVEEMAPAGVELVVGGFIDARFGPVVMLGLGGVFVEIMKDTNFRVCPITRSDAQDMINELRGVALLRGARGREQVDESLVVDCLLAIGGKYGLLVEQQDEIAELDINPLIVSRSAAVACDARIVLTGPDRCA
jgi:acyl-CoA synthetase (NDP forming)